MSTQSYLSISDVVIAFVNRQLNSGAWREGIHCKFHFSDQLFPRSLPRLFSEVQYNSYFWSVFSSPKGLKCNSILRKKEERERKKNKAKQKTRYPNSTFSFTHSGLSSSQPKHMTHRPHALAWTNQKEKSSSIFFNFLKTSVSRFPKKRENRKLKLVI